MGKLSALAVKAATKLGTYKDSDGLMLVVKASGSRSWVLRHQVEGKRRDFGLGSAGVVGLAEARGKPMRKFTMSAAALLSFAFPACASATTYELVQTGYSDGAEITGSFTGSDLNHDGILSSFEGELTSLVLHYSGSSEVAAFTLTNADFTPAAAFQYETGGLTYNLDGTIDLNDYINTGNVFGDEISLGGADSVADFYCVGTPGCGDADGDFSVNAITVTAEAIAPAPEPAGWAMFIIGFGVIGGFMRRMTMRDTAAALANAPKLRQPLPPTSALPAARLA